jgi:hypothetical protein
MISKRTFTYEKNKKETNLFMSGKKMKKIRKKRKGCFEIFQNKDFSIAINSKKSFSFFFEVLKTTENIRIRNRDVVNVISPCCKQPMISNEAHYYKIRGWDVKEKGTIFCCPKCNKIIYLNVFKNKSGGNL